MRAAVAALLLTLTACSDRAILEPSPLEPSITSAEGMASLQRWPKPMPRMTCDVQLQVIKSPMPPGDPVKTWLRATYIGADCTNGPTYPYYPAPRWGVDRAYVMQWGADGFIAYLWPNVPGDFTVTAMAPVGKVGTLTVHVP